MRNININLDEPSDKGKVSNGLYVSGYCRSDRDIISLTGSINGGSHTRGILGLYQPDLRLSYNTKDTAFSIFFPIISTAPDKKNTMELVFQFEDGNREIYKKELTLIVQGLIDQEDYPYQLVLHNAGVEGRALKRENIYGYGPPTENPIPEVLDMILHYAGNKVLDVGCGIGVYVAELSKAKKEAIGIEVNTDHVMRGQSLNRDVKYYDGSKIPFEDNSFDTVIAIEVLEHVDHWEELLREMIRVTTHNIFFSVPNIGVLPAMSKHEVVPWHILESTHLNFFTKDILSGCLSRIEGITFAISTYAPMTINQEVFYKHLAVIIEKNE